MSEQIKIPARFWAGMSTEEFMGIVRRNGLDGEQCQRLWRMQDRQDAPPNFLEIRVRREDVMRVWPEKAKP
jgi:hypothetical protein